MWAPISRPIAEFDSGAVWAEKNLHARLARLVQPDFGCPNTALGDNILGAMGYWTELTLVGIKFPKASLPGAKRDLKAWKKFKTPDMQIFLCNAKITPNGGLDFEYERHAASYFPVKPDSLGFTPTMEGKWSGDDQIARWLATHSARGIMSFRSLEGDGVAWLFEFDGKGRYRRHELVQARWKRPPKKKGALTTKRPNKVTG